MKKIVNVKRFVVSNVLLISLIVMVISIVINITCSDKEIKYKTVYVDAGDTLWNIALSEKQNNQYYKNKDVRDIVQNIKEVNNLNMSSLKVNQKILIPVI